MAESGKRMACIKPGAIFQTSYWKSVRKGNRGHNMKSENIDH
jgi:hypothetical protein